MRTEKFLCPSFIYAEIREATGADDDILSSQDEPNVVLNKYLSNILVSLDGKTPVTPDMVKDLRIRDKYFILIKSRIFSLGPNLIFSQDWGDSAPKEEYSFDLRYYIWDYTQPFPEVGSPDYYDQRIPPYEKGDRGLITINLGSRVVRMKFLDGHGEEALLKIPTQNRTVNSQLVARQTEVSEDGVNFFKVVNFSVFSSREMVEIRSKLEANDPPVEGLIRLTHPITKESIAVSLIQIRDFFFPVKV